MPKSSKEGVLPRPHRIHHIVEDFLTLWYAAMPVFFKDKFKSVIAVLLLLLTLSMQRLELFSFSRSALAQAISTQPNEIPKLTIQNQNVTSLYLIGSRKFQAQVCFAP